MSKAEETRRHWLETLEKFRADPDAGRGGPAWSPAYDFAGPERLIEIQNAKLKAVTPFLYENSDFYRRRFDSLGLTPDDIQSHDDLHKWPVVDKSEMTADVETNPPFGSYTTTSDEVWGEKGWMLFSTSGTTGTPRIFRYTQVDRECWQWANARAMTAMGFGAGDCVFMATGYGPHVWAWGVQFALATLGIATIPGGGMDGRMRASLIDRLKPTILLGTPSYCLYLGRIMQELGLDPAASSIDKLFIAGEPGMSVDKTRQRIEALWGARAVEFYGCTEAAPSCGGYTCTAVGADEGPVFAHLMEDAQIWEVVDPDTLEVVPDGERGLSVCTNLNSESSPQLRFLIGDYTVLQRGKCACGRHHVRAMGSFKGRADDLLNLRGIKMFPVQIEEAVRAVSGVGDEYEVVLDTAEDGMDVMTVRIEHAEHHAPGAVVNELQDEVRARCEIRCDVDVLAPDTLPKTEFKAKRIRDLREKS